MRKQLSVYDVTAGGRTIAAFGTSAGNACRRSFREFIRRDFAMLDGLIGERPRGEEMSKLVKRGGLFTTPRTDLDNPAGCCFTGVSVECHGQVVRKMPKPETFNDLTKRACERAGLPWIPPRKLRGAE